MGKTALGTNAEPRKTLRRKEPHNKCCPKLVLRFPQVYALPIVTKTPRSPLHHTRDMSGGLSSCLSSVRLGVFLAVCKHAALLLLCLPH